MKTNYLLVSLLFLLSVKLSGQSRTINELQFISSPTNPGFGSLVEGAGYITSKDGYNIVFRPLYNSDTVMIGYKYNKENLESIVENDVIELFIQGLKYTLSGSKYSTVNELSGAWTVLTIFKKNKIEENLILVFKESCKLNDETVINTISFKPVDDFYIIDKLYETK